MKISAVTESPRVRILHTLRHFDYPLAAAVAALAVFGIFMIYAATNTGATPRLALLYSGQRLYAITGFILLLFFAFMDYHLFTRFYIPIYIVCVMLLGIVLLIGKDPVTGTARWLWLPMPGNMEVSIQPSEFTKLFIILFLARLLDTWKARFNHILFLFAVLLSVALPVALIQLQPSLSASLVVVAVSLTILVTAGLYLRTIITGLLIVVPVGVAAWFDMRREKPILINRLLPYQWERIEMFMRPQPGSDGYIQMEGSLRAIGTGGLLGKGFNNNSYVINGFNDFIFSVVAEQFGFIGGIALLAVLAFIIVKCLLAARKAFDFQGRLIAAGVAGMLLFETFVNAGVTMELLPNTGMPLPFMSHGGSAMWVHMAAIGMVINVALPRERPMFEVA